MKSLLASVSCAALLAMFPLVVTMGQKIGGAAAPSTSYGNPGGTGNRSSFWTVTTNITPSSGTVDNLVDGAIAANATDAFKMGSSSDRLKWIRFHATDGNAYCIDAFKWYADASNNHNDWLWAGTVNGEDWVELKDVVGLNGSTSFVEYTYTNIRGFTDYILWQKPGSLPSAVPFNEEIEFKISTAVSPASVATNVASYANKFGFLDRTAFLTVTSTSGNGGGTPSNLVDGGALDNSADAWWFTGGQSGREIVWDAGVGNTIRVEAIGWYQDNITSHGTWQPYWGDNSLAYTSFDSPKTLGGAGAPFYTEIALSGMPTGKRALRLLQVTGTTSSSPFLRESLLKASKT